MFERIRVVISKVIGVSLFAKPKHSRKVWRIHGFAAWVFCNQCQCVTLVRIWLCLIGLNVLCCWHCFFLMVLWALMEGTLDREISGEADREWLKGGERGVEGGGNYGCEGGSWGGCFCLRDGICWCAMTRVCACTCEGSLPYVALAHTRHLTCLHLFLWLGTSSVVVGDDGEL